LAGFWCSPWELAPSASSPRLTIRPRPSPLATHRATPPTDHLAPTPTRRATQCSDDSWSASPPKCPPTPPSRLPKSAIRNPNSAIERLRASLKARGLSPRKRFGQNFMVDPNFAAAVARDALIDARTLLIEVGPGTGFTAFRLARMVKSMTIVDVAAGNITRLREVLAAVPNVDFVCADLCLPGLAASLKRQFDVVEAIEVFEFLPDPAIALQNMGAALRSGGRLFLQFPNYRPPRSHGVTYFKRWDDLHALLREAGFKNCEVYSLRLRPYADFLFRNLHEKPLSLYRWLRRRERASRPQTFENVWTYRHGGRLQKYKSLIYVAWMALMAACRVGGDCFMRTPLHDDIMDHNVLVVAER